MKTVIVLGSARKNGETKKVVSELRRNTNWDLIELLDYNISHYDYKHLNRHDDFLKLIKRITDQYEVIVFATPVYWYAMSGILKVFFDRISDLLTIEKELGRRLRNKSMAVISSSNGNNLGDHFWLPFRETAEYLGMRYIGDLHTYQDEMNLEKLLNFKRKIEAFINDKKP